jgi:cellobiose-specific phosphotransferase system component IIA
MTNQSYKDANGITVKQASLKVYEALRAYKQGKALWAARALRSVADAIERQHNLRKKAENID